MTTYWNDLLAKLTATSAGDAPSSGEDAPAEPYGAAAIRDRLNTARAVATAFVDGSLAPVSIPDWEERMRVRGVPVGLVIDAVTGLLLLVPRLADESAGAQLGHILKAFPALVRGDGAPGEYPEPLTTTIYRVTGTFEVEGSGADVHSRLLGLGPSMRELYDLGVSLHTGHEIPGGYLVGVAWTGGGRIAGAVVSDEPEGPDVVSDVASAAGAAATAGVAPPVVREAVVRKQLAYARDVAGGLMYGTLMSEPVGESQYQSRRFRGVGDDLLLDGLTGLLAAVVANPYPDDPYLTQAWALSNLAVVLIDPALPQVVSPEGDIHPESSSFKVASVLMDASESEVLSAETRVRIGVLAEKFKGMLSAGVELRIGGSLPGGYEFVGLWPGGNEAGGNDSGGPVGEYSRNTRPLPPVVPVDDRPLEELLADLDALVGLESVKAAVRRDVALQRVSVERARRGLATTQPGRHMVFTGNPGTGKTTVARMIASLYHRIGVLSKGHLVEVGPDGLTSQFLGASAEHTGRVLQQARGGVLLVDEAYALAGTAERGPDQFQQQVIDTIVKAMEDYRDDLVVIFTGYTEQTERFIRTNPGLASRISSTIEFPDYTLDELTQVLDTFVEKAGMILTHKARAAFADALKAGAGSLGNARLVRAILEDAIAQSANRVSRNDLAALTDSELSSISVADMRAAIAENLAKVAQKRDFGFLA